MEEIPSTDLKHAASAEKNVTELRIGVVTGVATYKSGYEGEILPGHGHHLDGAQADQHFRVSVEAGEIPGIHWIRQNERFWSTFDRIILINFNGACPNDLIVGFVSKLTSVQKISFTYFAAPSFSNIIDHISSPHLEEITAHVIGTTTTVAESFEALHRYGNRIGDGERGLLEHVMLIYGQGLPHYDVAIEANRFSF